MLCSFEDCAGENCEKVSHIAHLGGASAGVFAAIVCLENRKKEKWESFMRKVILALIITLYFVAVLVSYGGADWFSQLFPDNWFPKQHSLSWNKSKGCCYREIQDICCPGSSTIPKQIYCAGEIYFPVKFSIY